MVTGLVIFVVAVLVVLATSLFKTVDMSDKAKNLIAVVLSAVGGGLTALGTNGWDFSGFGAGDVLGTVLIVYGAAEAIYNFILKGTRPEAVLAEKRLVGGSER